MARSNVLRVVLSISLTLTLGSLAHASSFVRIAHLSPDAPNVDVRLDGVLVASNVPFTGVSDYLSVESGPRLVQVTPAGQAQPVVIDETVTLVTGTTYMIAATGLLSNGLSALVIEDDTVTTPGQTEVRFVHASPDAPAVDVGLAAGGATLFPNFVFGDVAPQPLAVAPGTVDLDVRFAGTANVALPLPGVQFEADTNVTVFAIGLVADGSLTALIAPVVSRAPALVRVAHLSPDAPNVDVYVDGNLTLEDVPFRAVSNYLELPAGPRNFQVTPANQTQPVVIDATVSLDAGTTTTIAAKDVLASIAPQVIADDRTTDPMMTRVRFSHQSPDAPPVDVALAGGSVLFPNFTFGDVAPDYLSVAPGTVDLEVRLAGTSNVALPLPGVTLPAGATVTVYAVGLLADGTLDAEIVIDADERFVRGDVDRDGVIGIVDAIGVLDIAFASGDLRFCTDAADVNDDGHVTLTDAIAHLAFQFAGGGPPAAPFPGLDVDPTADDLICQ